jgi:cytochrome c oxidase cbb3-type subunit 3
VRDIQLEKTFGVYAGKPLDQLAQDPRAQELGRSIFANTCAACHGSSAKGAPGYPNLTDEFWNWGGQQEQILASVLDGRQAVMPPQGEILKGMGGDSTIPQVAAYVRTLRMPNAEEALQADPLATQGKTYFDGLCVACHGPTGEGNPDLGAPNLSSHNPLYANSEESITKTILEGRQSMMPAHRELLGETRSRLVAAYVWSLSNSSKQVQSTGLQ